ncbi:MAG: zinc ribbon domain-containing protein [Candidatus Acidiferrales bacterium]
MLCPKCGKELADDSRFCTQCGQAVTLSQPLDPRRSPWKRGDLCTRGFKAVGFVLAHTPEYLEIRWGQGIGTEKIPAHQIDDIWRLAHAGALSTADDQKTNLEVLEALLSLEKIRDAMASKTFKNEREKLETNKLLSRAFGEEKCDWDVKNGHRLFRLAVNPESVGVIFKIRERIHRVFRNRSH